MAVIKLENEYKVFECFYPLSNKLNKTILNAITRSKSKTNPLNDAFVFKMTDWNFNETYKLCLNDLLDFISCTIKKEFDLCDTNLKCNSCWGVIYNKGDYILPHSHSTEASYSFVYYLNAPKGSSPLIFSKFNYEVIPEFGKLVIFDSRLFHEVPKNKSENRACLVGNFSYV